MNFLKALRIPLPLMVLSVVLAALLDDTPRVMRSPARWCALLTFWACVGAMVGFGLNFGITTLQRYRRLGSETRPVRTGISLQTSLGSWFWIGWIAAYAIGWALVVQLNMLVRRSIPGAPAMSTGTVVVILALTCAALVACGATTGYIVGQSQKMLLRRALPQLCGWRKWNVVGWLIAGMSVAPLGLGLVGELRVFNKGIISRFSSIHAVAYSPDGTKALTGSEDGTAILWDVASGERLVTFTGHTDYVYRRDVMSVSFSPDGDTVSTGGFDKTVRLWDATTGKAVVTLSGHEGCVHSVAFSPDGSKLLSGSWDYTAKLWDVATEKELRTLRGSEREINSAVFSPDGTKILTVGRDGTARLWSSTTGDQLTEVGGPSSFVSRAVFSPDGSKFVTAGLDYTVKLWDSATGAEIATFTGFGSDRIVVSSIAFSPDGSKVAVGGYTMARLLDASDGHVVRSLAVRRVNAVAFSPDGARVLTGSDDKARLWDTASGKELRAFVHMTTDWLLGTANVCLFAGLLALGTGFSGLVVGLLQWSVLRRHVPRAGRWIWANIGAWGLGAFVIGVLLVNLVPQTGQEGVYSVTAAIGDLPIVLVVATGGAVAGAVTCWVLVRLLRSA